MLREFWKKLTGKKEDSAQAPSSDQAQKNSLGQFVKGKVDRKQLFRMMRDPNVRRQVTALYQRMQADGVNIKSEQEVMKWFEAHKEELEKPPDDTLADKVKPEVRAGPKIGRNDPCRCGSGKKYKKCCGAGADVAA